MKSDKFKNSLQKEEFRFVFIFRDFRECLDFAHCPVVGEVEGAEGGGEH